MLPKGSRCVFGLCNTPTGACMSLAALPSVPAGVSVVEDIEKRREPLPLAAVYFISPSPSSIQHLVADFEAKPLYPSVHVFFSSGVSQDAVDRIKRCRVRGCVVPPRTGCVEFMVPGLVLVGAAGSRGGGTAAGMSWRGVLFLQAARTEQLGAEMLVLSFAGTKTVTGSSGRTQQAHLLCFATLCVRVSVCCNSVWARVCVWICLQALLERLKTLKEVNMEFTIVDGRTFVTGHPHALIR